MTRKLSISDRIWAVIGVTDELLALNSRPGYTPRQIMEIRGSFLYFFLISVMSLIAALFQFTAEVDAAAIAIPLAFNITASLMALLVYRRKKNLRNAKALSWAAALTFSAGIIISRYIYAWQLGWDIALFSYNIVFLYLVTVIVNQFLFSRKIYKAVFFLILINWIVFLATAAYCGADMQISMLNMDSGRAGFNILREIFVIIAMAFMSIVAYMNMPIIEAYEEKTVQQQKIIEEYNDFLSMKVEERTRELHSELKERKAAESSLRKLSAAVEHSPASICITDTNIHIEYINPKFSAMTGYSIEEIKGVRPGALLNMNLSGDEMRKITSIVRSGGTWSGELKNRKKNGEEYWELASISSIKNENGEITHYMAVEEDITLRKKIEEELKDRNEIIEKEISIAEMVQSTLLGIDRESIPFCDIDFRQLSFEKVGGDFLSVNSGGEDEAGIFIGDISGHGVASALFISLLKFMTDDIFRECSQEPVRYLTELNRRLLGYMSSYFLTGIYAHISRNRDQNNYRLTYSSGGHPAPVLIRKNGQIEFLPSQGSIIGIMDEVKFYSYESILGEGDRLYLFTDGLSETINAETGIEIGSGREMEDLFMRSAGGSLSDSLDSLLAGLNEIRGSDSIDDDLLITGIMMK